MASVLGGIQPGSSTTSDKLKLLNRPSGGLVISVGPFARTEDIHGIAVSCKLQSSKDFAFPRRDAIALIFFSSFILSRANSHDVAFAQSIFSNYIDTFDGYSFKYPQNWIQVRSAGADIFFRDPSVLDENLSVEISSPLSSKYKSVEDLGPPEEAGKKVLRQYLTSLCLLDLESDGSQVFLLPLQEQLMMESCTMLR